MGNENFEETNSNNRIRFNDDYTDENKYPYIDIDPISYITNLIIQFSKLVTKGRGLSQNGVNAFLLSILTATILYANTTLPKELILLIKMYSVPLVFFTIFIIDILKNNEKINNFIKRVYQRTDFIYYQIMAGDVGYSDLELYSNILSFDKKQLGNIIDFLHKRDLLTPAIQVSLLHNPSIYKIDTLI